MQNIEKATEQKQAHVAAIAAAFRANDEEALKKAFGDYQDTIEAAIKAEVDGFITATDNSILSARGKRALTSEERKFYTGIIAATKNGAPMHAINNITEVIPQTIFEDVLGTVAAEHPLLDKIGIRNTTGLTKWILDNTVTAGATWSALGGTITKEATGEVKVVDLTLCKLSAWFSISNDFLDLGPEWLDTYIRQILAEYIAIGLEDGIINGTGKDMPIGMTRNTSDDALVVGGEYPEKEAVAITDFSPASLSPILASLAKDRKGNPRRVQNLVLIVNPLDYFTVIFPSTTVLTPNGTYANNVLPYPADIIQCAAVAQGEAVFGLADKYFLGFGTGKRGKVETDDGMDDFFEDVTKYKVKLYGNGMPVDANAFAVLDISNVKPAYLIVKNIDITPAAGE